MKGLSLFVLQFISICVVSSIAVAAESESVQKDINLRYKSNVTLDCSSLAGTADGVEFYRRDEETLEDGTISHNDTLLVETHDYEAKYTLIPGSDGKEMSIGDLRSEDIRGVQYYCQTTTAGVPSQKIEFRNRIEPYIYKPEKASQTVTEGGAAELVCNVLYGLDDNDMAAPLTFMWKKNGTEVVSDGDRYEVVTTVNETRLLIQGVTQLDKGTFACVLSNQYGEHSEEIILRVKDMLAALWPFLGIVAEVVVLCAIILIYEKKCSKKSNRSDNGYENEQSQNLMGNKNAQSSDVKKRNARA